MFHFLPSLLFQGGEIKFRVKYKILIILQISSLKENIIARNENRRLHLCGENFLNVIFCLSLFMFLFLFLFSPFFVCLFILGSNVNQIKMPLASDDFTTANCAS